MFCPECGEAVGLGPLDTRRMCRRGGSRAAVFGRWLGAILFRLTPRRRASARD